MAPIRFLSLIFISIFIVIQILFCASAQKQQNITLGSTLTPSQNSKWVSPNGQFAFGFYPLTPTLFVVGVWFDSIIPKTLAWTVLKDNKDIPVEKKSSLQLTDSGLSLSDDRKNVLWSSAYSGKVAVAAMLDNGNFVLMNAFFEIIWRSFDYPTDTLLPGQTLKSNANMFSKASTTNFSTGRFGLAMQGDSNLVLYPVERWGDPESAYLATVTFQLQDGLSLGFDPSGLLYLVNSTNITVFNVTEGNAGEGRFLRRVTLEIDGTLAQYVWNIDSNGSSWSSVWQPLKDPCKDVKGQCGNNAICRLTDQNMPNCTCPPQFNFIDREDHFKGCIRSSSPGQSCSTRSTMSRLDNTNWLRDAETDSDFSVVHDLSEIQCQQSCLNDCMCVVVTYDNAICRKKRLPLIDGRRALEITTRAFVKVSENEFIADSPLPQLPGEREGKTLVLIGIILLGFSASLLVAAFLVTWLCSSKLPTGKRKITEQHKVVEGLNAFCYKELEAATAGFRQELGRSTFGKVYKGELPDGRAIAVKSLLDNVWQGEDGEREFRTEMSVICTSHHKNLVQLYGFCNEGSHRLLVYEYMSNGSLDTALFVDSGFLDWRTRVQIAMGIARGLLYLHEECETRILHCDIKPENILLDQNYSPRISDFGLAKLLKADQTATLTGARGTKGYIAPEWINKMRITVKVDVYSFGVMLLEIVCCRKTIDLGAPENRILLSDWVYECLKHGRLSELVEQQQVEGEGNSIDSRQLERMVLVGLWCIQQDPGLRPYIKKVVQMMEGTVEIALPPAPGSFVGSLSL